MFRKWELPEIRGIYMGKPEILVGKITGADLGGGCRGCEKKKKLCGLLVLK